jgi:hypothetical protein
MTNSAPTPYFRRRSAILPSVPGETLLGPVSGIGEARHPGGVSLAPITAPPDVDHTVE